MIGTPLTIKNHDNGFEVVINDHTTDKENVIALQSFPTFEPDVRSQNQPRSGAHGEIRLPVYYGGMSIVLQGIIVGEDEAHVWELKKQLDDVMALSRTGYANPPTVDEEFPPMYRNTVRLSFTNPAGQSVFMDATPIKAVSYDRPIQQKYLLNFQVILRTNFPFQVVLGDDPIISESALGSVSKGFKLPTQLPLSLSNFYVQGATTIEMETAGFAVVRLYGSDDGVIVNPTITNMTNGTYTKILRSIYGADRYFLIDGLYQKMVDENGANVEQYSEGDYVYLEAGENVLIYTADNVIPN